LASKKKHKDVSKKNPKTFDQKKDKNRLALTRKKRNKQLLILVPIIAALVAIASYAVYIYSSTLSHTVNANFGPLGSAHVHAAFAVKLNGTVLDFSHKKYQVQSRYMHVENGDGKTLHRHATGVPVAEFFDSIGMNVTKNCFTLDNGTKYCSNGENKLEFYLNGNKTDSIANYVFNDDDRILIVYGDSPMQIKQDLDELRQSIIKK